MVQYVWPLLMLVSCRPDPGYLRVTLAGAGTVEAVAVDASGDPGPGVALDCTAAACSNEKVEIADFDRDFRGRVRLTAVPDEGWAFAGWDGDCAGAGTATTAVARWRHGDWEEGVSIDCAATFLPASPVLSLTVVGPGQVDSECGTCREESSPCECEGGPGDDITLVATPDDGAHLVSWSEPCAGEGDECAFEFDDPRTELTVTFAADEASPDAIAAYALGQYHTAVVTVNGRVFGVGDNFQGQCGAGSSHTECDDPFELAGGPYLLVNLWAGPGASSNLGVTAGGEAYGWGRNASGMLGTGDSVTVYEITRLGDETFHVAVDTGLRSSGPLRRATAAIGNAFACFVLDDHTVACSGDNASGQLGTGNTTPSTTPVAVSNLTDAHEIAAAMHAACAVHGTGSVACWGANQKGQLGQGGTDSGAHSTPADVPGITDAVRVTAGLYGFCAILDGGIVTCWGDDVTSPTPVTLPSKAIDVTRTVASTHALLDTGVVYSWGANTWGEFGTGVEGASATPVAGTFPAGIVSISGGAGHLCALTDDGDLWCAGHNDWSQLGQGSFDDDRHDTPVKFQIP